MFQQQIFQGPGTGTFTSHTLEILIMLGVAFLLGLWLGWVLWSRFKQLAEKIQMENTSLKATSGALRTEVDKLKDKILKLETEKNDLSKQVEISSDESAADSEKIQDLQQELEELQDQNRQMAINLNLQDEKSDDNEGIAMEVAPPSRPEEPEQAGEDQQTEYTAPPSYPELDTPAFRGGADLPQLDPDEEGETLEGIGVNEDLDEVGSKSAAFFEGANAPLHTTVAQGPQDDLKIIEGIGPKIEELLFKNGIHTYTELARTPVNHLKDILTEAGPRFAMHDPGTWSAQALLAGNGEWDNLKAYQEFLNAGKSPK